MAWQFVAAGSVATGANPTPALPTGWAQGDLLVFVASSSASYGANNPSGYTNLVKNTAASPFFAVWYKTAGSSESAVSVTNANTTSKAVVLAYRYVGALDVTGTLVTGSTTATATSSVTTTGKNALVLNLYGAGVTSNATGSWSGGSANSRVSSGTSTSLCGVYCTDESQAAAGATTSRTGTISRASTGTQGVTIAFTSAAFTTTGALTGPGSTVAGTSVHNIPHATSGTPTGPGSTIVGTARRFVTHTSTGTPTGPGAAVVGAAKLNPKHTTTGALTGPGSTIVGAARTAINTYAGVWDTTNWDESRWVGTTHATTGTLAGQSATVAGSAARAPGHPTSGALTGQGSTVSGTAARTHVFSSVGVLTGQGALITGQADTGTVRTSSGALVGPGSTVSGASARLRAFDSSGVLTGPGSTVDGSSQRFRAFDTSGALTGQGSAIDGAASHNIPHATSGDLTGEGSEVRGFAAVGNGHFAVGDLIGQGSIVTGEAERIPGAVTHDTTGDLVGQGSAVSGQADHAIPPPLPLVEPDVGAEKRRIKKRDEALEKYRQEQLALRKTIEAAIDPVKAKAEPVVVSEGRKKVEVLSVDGAAVSIPVPALFNAEEVARVVAEVLEDARVAAMHVKRRQDAQRALEAARVEMARIIKRKRDDELLLLMD